MLTRRNVLLGLGLATAGCAGQLGGSGLPPGIQTGNIAPDDNPVLGPDENILVGMVSLVFRIERVPGEREKFWSLTDPAEQSILLPALAPLFFIFEGDRYRQFGIEISYQSNEFMTNRQPNETRRLIPFAMRVPKGPHRIIALMHRTSWLRLPPLEAQTRPGTVSYIGRFGEIRQFVKYSPATFNEQIRGFNNTYRVPTQIYARPENGTPPYYPFQDVACNASPQGDTIPRCLFRDLFFHSDADQDLPLIRQRFPRLSHTQIVNAPMVPNSHEVWKRWPDVLRPLSVT